MPNGISLLSIGPAHFHFKGFCVVVFIFIKKKIQNILSANSGEPDQMPRTALFDLDLHHLPMSHKKDAMLIWIK